ELTPVRVGQLAERILVAGACTREHLVGHARILAPTVPFTRITVMTSARPEIRHSISLAANASTHATPTSPSKEIQDGKDCGQRERLARWRRRGPKRRAGVQARRLVCPVHRSGLGRVD